MRLRLRTRVALSFAALSLLVAGTVSVTTYAFASWYLLDQRETAALTRAALDSRAVGAYLATGSAPSDALGQIPSVGTSQPMIRVARTWYTTAVTVPPNDLPEDLLAVAEPNGARQRFSIAGDPYLAVAVQIDSAMYVEVFPLRDLDRTLGRITFSNIGLKPWTADNYDVSVEYYTDHGGVVSAGVFLKEVKDFFGAYVKDATGVARTFARLAASGDSPQPSLGVFWPSSHSSHPFAARSSKGHADSRPTACPMFVLIAFFAIGVWYRAQTSMTETFGAVPVQRATA